MEPIDWNDSNQMQARTFSTREVFGEELELVPEPPPTAWEAWQEVVHFIKSLLVIVTCLATLYSLVEFWLFIARLQNALQQLSTNLGGN